MCTTLATLSSYLPLASLMSTPILPHGWFFMVRFSLWGRATLRPDTSASSRTTVGALGTHKETENNSKILKAGRWRKIPYLTGILSSWLRYDTNTLVFRLPLEYSTNSANSRYTRGSEIRRVTQRGSLRWMNVVSVIIIHFTRRSLGTLLPVMATQMTDITAPEIVPLVRSWGTFL